MLGRLVIVWLLLLTNVAAAQEAPAVDEQIDKVIAGSKIAIEQGQLEIARKMLGAVLQTRPDNPDALFLLGTIASLQGRWEDAIGFYRSMLETHPGLIRDRLELARALFE